MAVGSARWRPFVPYLAVAAGWLLFQALITEPTPRGVIALGVVFGCLNAMLAVGIVLVYRANRIVNFAHGELGGVAVVLVIELVQFGWPFVPAAIVGVLSALAAGSLVEATVIRRCGHSSRLILMAATIGLAQVLGFVALFIPHLFAGETPTTILSTPLSNWTFRIEPLRLTGNAVLIVAVAVCASLVLAWFMRRTKWGVAIRASAEGGTRASQLGVPTNALSNLVWAAAGALSAVTAILGASMVSLQPGQLLGPGLLLRGLAAAVVARMRSLPLTVVAAVGIGIGEQALRWEFPRSNYEEVFLLGVVLVALLFQHRSQARADASDASSWQLLSEVRQLPAEVAGLREIRAGRVVVALGGTALVLSLPLLLSPSHQILVNNIVIYAIVAVSLVVLTGWAGQVSLGQFALVAVGAGVAGNLTLNRGVDLVVAVLAGALAGAVAALVIGLPAVRVRGFLLGVTTLGAAVATSTYLLRQSWLAPSQNDVVPRPELLGRFDVENDGRYYFVCLAVLAAAVYAANGIRRSRLGRSIVATRDNAAAAQAWGVRPALSKLAAFALSGAMAGAAGALLIHQQRRLAIELYAPEVSLQAFTMAVIGGIGSMPGAILGAAYVRGVGQWVPGVGPLLATGIGLLIVLLLLPRGLADLVRRGRDVLVRQVAKKHGVAAVGLLSEGELEALGHD